MSRRAHERKERPPYRATIGEAVCVDCEPPLSGTVLQVRGSEALVEWWKGADWFALKDLGATPDPQPAPGKPKGDLKP